MAAKRPSPTDLAERTANWLRTAYPERTIVLKHNVKTHTITSDHDSRYVVKTQVVWRQVWSAEIAEWVKVRSMGVTAWHEFLMKKGY